MSISPVAVDCKTTVADACKLMGEKHIGSILVAREGIVHGIFTERDLLSKVLAEKKDIQGTIENLISLEKGRSEQEQSSSRQEQPVSREVERGIPDFVVVKINEEMPA